MDTRAQETWIATRLPFPQPSEEPLDAAIFVETSTGKLRHLDLIPASSNQLEFSQCLWRAIRTPSSKETPYRPGALVVDSQDLYQAARSMAGMQQIALHHDPSLGELVHDALDGLMASMEQIGFCYNFDEDINLATVGQFFEDVYKYLEAAPWNEFLNEDVIVIEGLEVSPLFAIVMGAGGEYGLALCLNEAALDTVFSGEEDEVIKHPCLTFTLESVPGPALSEEIETNGWRVHPLGVPTLIRYDRHERLHPTNEELRMASEALEAILLFMKCQDVELDVRLSTGSQVQVCMAAEDYVHPVPALAVSLTPGQRRLVAELCPQLKSSMELVKKGRQKVLIPFEDLEIIEELLSKFAFRFRGHKLTAARELRYAIAQAIDDLRAAVKDLDSPSADMDHDQCMAFIDRLLEGFEQSPEFEGYPEKEPSIGVFFELAFALDEVPPQLVGRVDCETVLLDMFPAKVSLDSQDAKDYLNKLAAFFCYARREHNFHLADECLQTIRLPRFIREFEKNLANSDLFGTTKSLIQYAIDAGFDVDSEEGLREAVDCWNSQIALEDFPAQDTVGSLNSNKPKKSNKRKKMGKQSRKKNRRR